MELALLHDRLRCEATTHMTPKEFKRDELGRKLYFKMSSKYPLLLCPRQQWHELSWGTREEIITQARDQRLDQQVFAALAIVALLILMALVRSCH